MRIDEVLAEVKPLKVEFPGAILNIEYAPPSFTLDELSKDKDTTDPDKVVERIQSIIKAWDLTRQVLDSEGAPVRDDNGQIIETLVDLRDPAELKKYVPINIWNTIMRAIKEDNSPGEA